MNKNKIVTCVLFFLLIVPFTVAYGSWTQTDKEGEWTLDLHNYWETPDNGTWHVAELDFDYGWVLNFTEWKATITQESRGYGCYLFDDDFEVKTILTLVDNASSHTVELLFWAGHDVWFIWGTWENSFEIYVDGELKYQDRVKGSRIQGTRRYYFDVYQNPDDASELVIKARSYDLDWVLCGGFNGSYTFGSSWFSNVSLTQTHDAWGKGWCYGTKEGELIKSNEPAEGTDIGIPSLPESLWVQLWHLIQNAGAMLPEPMKTWLATLQDWLGTFWQLLIMVWGMVVAFLPVLGIFYFMSFIGVFFTGVVTGNMGLIEGYVMKQYELANNFANTIVSTIHAIWSLIKIW